MLDPFGGAALNGRNDVLGRDDNRCQIDGAFGISSM